MMRWIVNAWQRVYHVFRPDPNHYTFTVHIITTIFSVSIFSSANCPKINFLNILLSISPKNEFSYLQPISLTLRTNLKTASDIKPRFQVPLCCQLSILKLLSLPYLYKSLYQRIWVVALQRFIFSHSKNPLFLHVTVKISPCHELYALY